MPEERCARCGCVLQDGYCPACASTDSGVVSTDVATNETRIVSKEIASGATPLPDPPQPAGKSTAPRMSAPAPPPAAQGDPAILGDKLLRDVPVIEGAKVLRGIKLTKRLGAGGMGAVYAGHHPVLDMPVAVKIMHAHLGGDDAYIERFLREAKVSARIDHHNLVRTLDAGYEFGLSFLVMEFVEGKTAAELLRSEGPLSETRAIKIVLDATRGLAEAHRRGVVHRDVKPDNILVRTEDDRGKLTDLGLARALERSPSSITGSGTTLGTPAYMAPEQIEDASGVGPQADVYSMGATLYELLCGCPPFTGSTISALFQQILARPPTDPAALRPGITPAVRDLVLRALEKDPKKRFASADEMERELETVLAVASKEIPAGGKVDPAKRETAPIVHSALGKDTAAVPPPSAARPLTPPPPLPTPPFLPSKTDAALIPDDTDVPRRRFSVMSAIRTGATVVIAAVLVVVFWGNLPIRSSATITIGFLPDRRVTTDRLKELQPLAKFLEKATGKKTEIYIGGSYQDNLDAFVDGRIQIAQFGGVTYVLAKQRVPESTPLVQRETDQHYRSLVIVKTGSHLRKLDDLRGKRFAFVDPLSTSGWVVPACAMLQAGIEPRSGAGMESAYFTHAHDVSVEAVAHGEADGAAVDESDFYRMLETRRHDEHLDPTALHPIFTSMEFPDDVWVASPSMDEKAREKARRAFLSLDYGKDQDRLTLLALEAKKYVPARDEEYDGLREKVKLLQSKGLMGE